MPNTGPSKRDFDLFMLGKWARGAEDNLAESAFFQIPLATQFNLMRNQPALKDLWDQYCTFLHLCYSDHYKDNK